MSLVLRETTKFLGNNVFSQVKEVVLPLGLSVRKGPKKPVGGGKSAMGMSRLMRTYEVETDPEKLVSHCCGLNYSINGEPPKLKPDSEYPEWLFTMDIKRPRPASYEMENKDSFEYWLTVEKERILKRRRLISQGLLRLKNRK